MPGHREKCQYLGPRLQRLRRERGWTQEHLGQLSHVEPVTISRYERGLRLPSLPKLLALAEALQIDAGDLVAPPSSRAEPSVSGPPEGPSAEVAHLVDAYLLLSPQRRVIVTQLLEALRDGEGA